MNIDYERLSKIEVQEIDDLLKKLMLYLQSLCDSELDDKDPKLSLELTNLHSDEELLRRF